MVATQKPMSGADTRHRASVAREYLQVADERLEYARSREVATGALPGPSAEASVAASNAVLAGIAASDAMCGKALGYCHGGPDHAGAVKLLKTLHPDGPALSIRLRRLLSSKTQVQYGGYCTSAVADALIKDARVLIDALAVRKV